MNVWEYVHSWQVHGIHYAVVSQRPGDGALRVDHGFKGCISDVRWLHFCWCSKRDPKLTEAARPSLPCFVHPVKTIMNAEAKPRPTTCRWLVGILFTSVLSGWLYHFLFCPISEHLLPKETHFLTVCLWGGLMCLLDLYFHIMHFIWINCINMIIHIRTFI